MNSAWFYSHEDVTYGPFSEEEMKERVAGKMLAASDFIWRKERKASAVKANTVFDFSAPASVPDWLVDVAAAESNFVEVSPVEGTETPDWLEDLSLWIELEEVLEPEEPPKRAIEIAPSTPSAAVPDWLQDWLAPEPPPEPAPPKPPPLAVPVAQPVKFPALAVPIAAPVKPPVDSPTAKPPSTPMPTANVPVAAPKPERRAPAPSLADKVREATGFDADTGQIIDPIKFARWKQQTRPSAAGQASVSNASLFEVFRKGRTAIESWVDDDQTRLCIMHATADEIKRNPQVQAILQEYANYGKDLQDKLLRHLEFMVENRKKYYNAMAGKR
jgi:hypothetical protein